MSQQTTALISTEGLCKKYGGVLRVNDLALTVPEGTVYGFLGPNGAGKSTTLKMILGLARPTSGSIRVFGREMNGRNRLSILKDVGSLIESPSYYGHLSGEENLQIVRTLRGASQKNVDEVLQIVRLTNQKDKKVSQYSLGMKQRLGLAAALMGRPRLLVLDEPTNGLDPAGIQEMRELICSLPKQFGMTVVVSSHLLSEIDQMAGNLGIIDQGRLVFQGSLASLHAHSQKSLFLRTTDTQRTVELLAGGHLTCTIQDNGLLLPNLNDETMARCSVLLAKNGIGVLRIEEREKSLEDLFLELTGSAVSL